jgi:hypothetical protein
MKKIFIAIFLFISFISSTKCELDPGWDKGEWGGYTPK